MKGVSVCLGLAALVLTACSSEVITLAEASGGGGAIPGGNAGSGSSAGVGGAGAAGQGGGGSAGTGVGGGGLPGLGGEGGSYAGSGAAGSGGSFGGTGQAGSGAAGGEFCTPSSGCGGATYCELDGCGVLTGTCHPLPTTCDGTLEPSCGCDGLTYWNPCVRAWAGVGELYAGECASGFSETCSESQPCSESYATCFSSEPSCQVSACWVLPCPTVAPEVALSACGSGETCTDMCSATGGPMFLDGSCP